MSFLNFTIFILLCLLSWTSFRFVWWVYGDYFAPLELFLGINLVSLALNQLGLLPLVPVSTEAWVLIFLSLFSFTVGSLLATPSFAVRGKRLNYRVREDSLSHYEGVGAFFYITTLLEITGWVFYITVLMPPGWLSNPWILQGNYIFPYHLGYTLVAGTLALSAFVLLTLEKRRISFLAICLLAVNMLGLGVCGIKSYLVLSAVISFLTWATICPVRIRIRHLVFVGILLIGFMALYDRFIDVFAPRQFPGSKFPAVFSFLERPYLYIAGPWSAMSVVMADPPTQAHWGQVTLLPLWKLLGPGGLGLMERVPKYLPFVNIGPSYFNTYSLIGEVYWDFGWLGTILICFALGFVATRLYLVARKQGDWILCLLSAVFSYGLFISFFLYYYRDNLTFLLLYTLFVGHLSRWLSIKWRQFKYALKLCVRPQKQTL